MDILHVEQAPAAQALDPQADDPQTAEHRGLQGAKDERDLQAPGHGIVLTSVRGFPPNYAEIVKAFPSVKTANGPIFCYGSIVYYTKDQPDAILMRHEAVHSVRQGADPVAWWDRYLKEKSFRFLEELLAHRVEFSCYAKRGRNERRFMLQQISERLAGPLYGKMVNIRFARAMITATPKELDDLMFEMMEKAE